MAVTLDMVRSRTLFEQMKDRNVWVIADAEAYMNRQVRRVHTSDSLRSNHQLQTMPDPTWVSTDTLNADNRYKPPQDYIFNALFLLAMQGDLMVYFAAVPLHLIKPFSNDFKFSAIPNGQQIIDTIIDKAKCGNFARIWVYEKGDLFIMSDDYPAYEACLQGQPDYVPCWTLGRPRNPLVEDIQGPVDARQAAGFSA